MWINTKRGVFLCLKWKNKLSNLGKFNLVSWVQLPNYFLMQPGTLVAAGPSWWGWFLQESFQQSCLCYFSVKASMGGYSRIMTFAHHLLSTVECSIKTGVLFAKNGGRWQTFTPAGQCKITWSYLNLTISQNKLTSQQNNSELLHNYSYVDVLTS